MGRTVKFKEMSKRPFHTIELAILEREYPDKNAFAVIKFFHYRGSKRRIKKLPTCYFCGRLWERFDCDLTVFNFYPHRKICDMCLPKHPTVVRQQHAFFEDLLLETTSYEKKVSEKIDPWWIQDCWKQPN